MAEILFFAKQGCSRSRQQGTALEKAGNSVQWCDLLAVEWTRESLRPYMRGRRPLEIMDSQAPAIRSGKIDPLLLTWDEALALLAESPDLIKGPLVRVDTLHIQGENDSRIARYLNTSVPRRQKPSLKIGRNLLPRRGTKPRGRVPLAPTLEAFFPLTAPGNH